MSAQILVTHASCFLTQTLVGHLLDKSMNVRIATTSDSDSDALLSTLEHSKTSTNGLSFAPADPHEEGGWAEVMHGCNYVCHNILPDAKFLQIGPDLDMAAMRDETVRLLRAARTEISMKRVVVVSSLHAAAGRGERHSPPVVDENHWADAIRGFNATNDASRAVTYVERALWDYVRADGVGLELTTLLPGYAIAPTNGNNIPTRLAPLAKLLNGDYPGLPRLGLILTDARDLAQAQLQCLHADVAAGKRYLIADRFFWMSEIAAILRKAVPELRDSIPTFALPDLVFKAVGLFHHELRAVHNMLGLERRVSTNRIRGELGLVPRPGDVTLLETAHSLLRL